MLQRPRKKRLTWSKCTTDQKVELLYYILHTTMSRKEISEKTGRSLACIASTKREYCDTVTTKTVTLKKKKTHMAQLLESFQRDIEETQG